MKTITVPLTLLYWVVSAWALSLVWTWLFPISDLTFAAALGIRLVAGLCQADTAFFVKPRERLYNEFVGVLVMFFAATAVHIYLVF